MGSAGSAVPGKHPPAPDGDAELAAQLAQEEFEREEESGPTGFPNDMEEDGGGKDDGGGKVAAATERSDPSHLEGPDNESIHITQGPGSVLHPQSPRGRTGASLEATPRVLHGSEAPTVEEVLEDDEEVPGPNFAEWEGVQPNPFEDYRNFDDCPPVGEEEDELDGDDIDRTMWKATKMQSSHFRYAIII